MICVSVDHLPKAKGRPRFARGGRAYTPPETRWAEGDIAQAVSQVYDGPPLAGPIMLGLRFRLPAPKKCSGWRTEAAKVGAWWPPKRVDLDNLEKLTKDALNGVLWVDDSQVMACVKVKMEDGQPGTDIVVVPLTAVTTAKEWQAVQSGHQARPPAGAVWSILWPRAT